MPIAMLNREAYTYSYREPNYRKQAYTYASGQLNSATIHMYICSTVKGLFKSQLCSIRYLKTLKNRLKLLLHKIDYNRNIIKEVDSFIASPPQLHHVKNWHICQTQNVVIRLKLK